MTKAPQPWHNVRQSPLHGNGVFAAREIPAGARVLEYGGRRITPEQADAMHPVNPDDPFHTFFFSTGSGKIIDGGNRGNDARWINHSCEPNCEARENTAGTRVYIVALRNIQEGEELSYDYGLIIDDKITKKLQKQYRCLCGSPQCRKTMLALPEKEETEQVPDKPKKGGGKKKDKPKNAKPGKKKEDGKLASAAKHKKRKAKTAEANPQAEPEA